MADFLKIEVAKHIVELRIKESYLLNEVSINYSIFLSDGEPDIKVDLELSPDVPSVDSPLAKLELQRNFMGIVDDYLMGSVDLKHRYGWVKINPKNPLYPLGTFLRNMFTLLVCLQDEGVVLHAVGLLHNNEVYIFIGPSKAGKTTVAKLSPDKVVLSDDMVVVKKFQGEFMVFPTPCWGDMQTGISQNRPYGINSMFKIIKDKSVYLERLSPAYALADIFTVPHVPAEFIPEQKMLTTFSEIIFTVPYYGLHFLPEPSFWDCIEAVRLQEGFMRVD